MEKTLIAYFSASGVTKEVAEKIATIVEGDLFAIEPVETYTDEDLNWMNKKSRKTFLSIILTTRPISQCILWVKPQNVSIVIHINI